MPDEKLYTHKKCHNLGETFKGLGEKMSVTQKAGAGGYKVPIPLGWETIKTLES